MRRLCLLALARSRWPRAGPARRRSTPSRPSRSTAARCGCSRTRRPSTSRRPTASRPIEAWYRRARLASLRMPGCSASFVSPNGLVLTNHHCAQSHIVAVDRGGEGLLDDGFQATSLSRGAPRGRSLHGPGGRHRRRDGAMSAPVDAAQTDAERESAFEAAEAAVTARLLAARGITAPDPEADDFVVQVVALYNGGRTRRTPSGATATCGWRWHLSKRSGFFGGDPDNFTYPRYAVDFAFFRIYGDDGQPLGSPEYFPLSAQGVEDGSVVFVIGNPGSTSRGLTVAELEFLRDAGLGGTLRFIETREAALRDYLASGEDPEPGPAPQPHLRAQQRAQGLRRPAPRPRATPTSSRAARRPSATSEPPAPRRPALDRPAGGRPGREARAVGGLPRLPDAVQPELRLGADAAGPGARPGRRRGGGGRRGPTGALERAYLTAEVDALRAYYRDAGRGAARRPRRPVAPRRQRTRCWRRRRRPSQRPTPPRPSTTRPSRSSAGCCRPSRRSTRPAPGCRPAKATSPAGSGGPGSRPTGTPSRPTPRSRSASPTASCSGYPYNGTLAPPMTTLYGLFDRYHSFCSSGASDPCEWDLPAALARRPATTSTCRRRSTSRRPRTRSAATRARAWSTAPASWSASTSTGPSRGWSATTSTRPSAAAT